MSSLPQESGRAWLGCGPLGLGLGRQRVCGHVHVHRVRVHHVCVHGLQPWPAAAHGLPSSCGARRADRACNHGKLSSAELKLRLLLCSRRPGYRAERAPEGPREGAGPRGGASGEDVRGWGRGRETTERRQRRRQPLVFVVSTGSAEHRAGSFQASLSRGHCAEQPCTVGARPRG